MKLFFSCLAVLALTTWAAFSTAAWADEMAGTAMSTPAVSRPAAQTTPPHKKHGKKIKKTRKNKKTKIVWVCPMGDYSGPRTADGKCPKCGMDLVKEVVPIGWTPAPSGSAGK